MRPQRVPTLDPLGPDELEMIEGVFSSRTGIASIATEVRGGCNTRSEADRCLSVRNTRRCRPDRGGGTFVRQHLPITLKRTCAPAYSQALQVTWSGSSRARLIARMFTFRARRMA